MAKGYYHRSFVILQPKDVKFSVTSEKTAAGYCKIEVRNDICKMHFHVQDLKPRQTDKEGYDIFLVSAQENVPPQKIASISVDHRGRGECTLELNVNRIGDSEYSLDQFHGLAVVCNDDEGIKYPLVGYANKRVELDWTGQIKRHIEKIYNKSTTPMFDRRNDSGPHHDKTTLKDTHQVAQKEMTRSKIEPQHRDKEPASDLKTADEERQKAIQDIIWELGSLLQNQNREQESKERENQMNLPDSGGTIHEQGDFKDAVLTAYEMESDRETAKEQRGITANDEGKLPEMQQNVYNVDDIESQGLEYDDIVVVQPENIIQEGKTDEECDREKTASREILYGKESIAEQKEYYLEQQEYAKEKGDVEQRETASVEKHTYWDKAKEYYGRLFETHRRVYPFIIDMEEVEWIEVPQTNNYNRYNYIGMTYSYNNYYDYPYYDHYIVGLMRENGEVRYVVYGIPGGYGAISSMFMQGFSKWLPARYGHGMGYWLMYIDACTGEIAYPY